MSAAHVGRTTTIRPLCSPPDVARFEPLHITRILDQTPDKREAAKRLNIGLSSLYRKLEEEEG